MSETHQDALWRGFPKTLIEFDERFASEEACHQGLSANQIECALLSMVARSQ